MVHSSRLGHLVFIRGDGWLLLGEWGGKMRPPFWQVNFADSRYLGTKPNQFEFKHGTNWRYPKFKFKLNLPTYEL